MQQAAEAAEHLAAVQEGVVGGGERQGPGAHGEPEDGRVGRQMRHEVRQRAQEGVQGERDLVRERESLAQGTRRVEYSSIRAEPSRSSLLCDVIIE